ncbi:MAG: pyridoxal phosphate-dependent aminotransferase [Saccharofermentanales bacterium]|nr:pyridoxal phosphate-dependent class II aminotransferase [Bacillota bacterium]
MIFPEYQHGGDIYGIQGVDLDFSVNLHPAGMPLPIQEAIIANIDRYDVYPDPYCRKLAIRVAELWQLDPSWLCFGNGAADLIFRLFFVLRPRRLLILAPTFSEYEEAAVLVGCEIVRFYLKPEEGFRLGSEILAQITAETDLVFLCNPNNPNGLLAESELMLEIIRHCAAQGTVLAVDECFMPFTSGRSLQDQIAEFDNLIIFRAFTKIFAMAGLRLGYVMCSNLELINRLRLITQPWAVSTVAQIAALAALDIPDWIEDTVALVASERSRVASALSELGLTVFPSDANYLLFNSRTALLEPLLSRGILIRSCANYYGLDESYYRIGLKRKAENIYLLDQLADILQSEREDYTC